jgi:hypothetical protein
MVFAPAAFPWSYAAPYQPLFIGDFGTGCFTMAHVGGASGQLSHFRGRRSRRLHRRLIGLSGGFRGSRNFVGTLLRGCCHSAGGLGVGCCELVRGNRFALLLGRGLDRRLCLGHSFLSDRNRGSRGLHGLVSARVFRRRSRTSRFGSFGGGVAIASAASRLRAIGSERIRPIRHLGL